MTVDDFLKMALTFLVGWLGSSLWYMWKFNDRLTTIEITMKTVVRAMESIKPADSRPCTYHIELDKRVVRVEEKIEGGG